MNDRRSEGADANGQGPAPGTPAEGDSLAIDVRAVSSQIGELPPETFALLDSLDAKSLSVTQAFQLANDIVSAVRLTMESQQGQEDSALNAAGVLTRVLDRIGDSLNDDQRELLDPFLRFWRISLRDRSATASKFDGREAPSLGVEPSEEVRVRSDVTPSDTRKENWRSQSSRNSKRELGDPARKPDRFDKVNDPLFKAPETLNSIKNSAPGRATSTTPRQPR